MTVFQILRDESLKVQENVGQAYVARHVSADRLAGENGSNGSADSLVYSDRQHATTPAQRSFVIDLLTSSMYYIATAKAPMVGGSMHIEIIWDLEDEPDGNIQHIAEHGISIEEFEETPPKRRT